MDRKINGKEIKTLKALVKELTNGEYVDSWSDVKLNAEDVQNMVDEAYDFFKKWYKKAHKNVVTYTTADVKNWTIVNICRWVKFPAGHLSVDTFDIARRSRPELYFKMTTFSR